MATPYMNITLPTVSSTLGPQWATELNAALTSVDSHNHSSGQGVPVPSTGININADLTFGGFNATNLRSARLSNQAAPLAVATDVCCLFASGGDLYYNNSGGTNVKITSGGSLNAAALGGIGGDYGTGNEDVQYITADTEYKFYSDSTLPRYAGITCGDIVIREKGLTSALGITIKSPASLAGAYSITLPSALPAGTYPMMMSAAGVISMSDTIATALTITTLTSTTFVATNATATGLTVGASYLTHTGGNPASSTAFTNKLTAMNTPKAWGLVNIDAAGVVTIVAGFNVTSGTVNGANDVTVTLASAMASSSYAVMVTGSDNSGGTDTTPTIPKVYGRTTTTFGVKMRTDAGAAIAFNDGTARRFMFVVYGAQ